MTKELELS